MPAVAALSFADFQPAALLESNTSAEAERRNLKSG